MKTLLFFFSFFLFYIHAAWSHELCFMAKENNHTIINEGHCTDRHTPQSTFKIALSLIGFDSGILKSANAPLWQLPENTDPYINTCKGAHNPRTWMRDSCLWYSRILTRKLGMKKFQDYVTQFSYGNTDLSGNAGQNNGLTHAWISSSLKISPEEQIDFLQKIINHQFSISKASYDNTQKIMFIQEMAGGWKLYGKTGNGNQYDTNGHLTQLQHGWFVGYIEKGGRHIVFATHLTDDQKETVFASMRAKNEALNKLFYLIQELEK